MNAHNEQHDSASPVVKQNLTTQPVAAQLGDRLDRAYAERNALAIAFAKAALAAGWRAGRGYDDDQSKDWAPEWRHVVYVDLPDGRQVSWHMAPAEVELLDRLPQYAGEWNGEFTARDPFWCRFDAPAAAQEAVVWQWRCPRADTDWSDCDKSLYDELRKAIGGEAGEMNGLRYEVRALYAAPVTAAPAGVTRDDAEQVIDRIMGEYGFSMPSRAYAELVYEFMCATAAPGIDLAALRARVVSAIERITSGAASMRIPADMTDPDLVLGDVLCLLDSLGPQTDASPKGGSEARAYTTGHCENHKKPGGCPLHNLQCGYPQCDRKPASDAEVRDGE